jgi:exodeoxyribonuclease V alpha subunit
MAIKSAFENKMTVITGGAGTGKSTLCRCISYLSKEKDLAIRMMSPTGKAARVLSSKTAFTAETIHRSLKMKPDSEYPAEEIREDMVIIDEFSMVGIDTMFAIMYAIKENLWSHIVMVGDPKQLASVSPGKFLTDIIDSGCANVVRLDKIYRQDENSFIPILANDISLGKVVDIPPNATDIKWNNLSSSDTWDISLRRVVKDFINENNVDDLQIIAPMYKGIFGINKTNEIMQDLMADVNGVKSEPFHRGFMILYVGDRVVQCVNDYEKSIFNGDLGKVIEAGRKATNPNSDEQKDYVTVNFYGDNITYIGDEIEDLRLAWSLSVHKFQGSQSPYVICILPNEASNMMSRELVYTAITRPSKRLDIYGHMSAFRLAPTRSAIRKRYTNMNNMIKELRDNQKIFKILE